MNYLYFFIFSIILFGYFCDNARKSYNSRDFNLSVPTDSIIESYKCEKACSSGLPNLVMIKSTVNNRSNLNSPIDDGIIASVDYKCMDLSTKSQLKEHEYYSTRRVCENKVYLCQEFSNSFTEEWYEAKDSVINVDLNLPYNSSGITVRTNNCVQEPIVFDFKKDKKSITYKLNEDYGFEKGDFSTRNFDESPITLSINKYPGSNIVNVVFTIRKSKCIEGIDEKFNNTLGYKCFIETAVGKIEAGYTSAICPSIGQQNSSLGRKDWCKEYKRGSHTLCKDLCYNTDDCSYVCIISKEGVSVEGGYIMNTSLEYYPGMIGSGRWRKTDIPQSLVLFNECVNATNLCDLGSKYCQDNDVAFSCSNGTYNLKECFTNKGRSPYWQCPADDSALSLALSTPGIIQNRSNSILYKNQIMNASIIKLTTRTALTLAVKIIHALSNKNATLNFNLPTKEKRDFASFLLYQFVENFCNTSNSKAREGFKSDFLYFYSEEITDDKREVNIPMSPESKENQTQFIKLELKRSQTRSKERITANYFQFKDLDMMNETGAIQNLIRNMTSIRNAKITPEDFEEEQNKEVLYKNSLMFTLKVSGTKNVKAVKYRLETIQKIETTSWLYEVNNVCGFLDERKNWTWSRNGCWLVNNVSVPYCECNHLSNFAMLFSIKEVNKGHLKVLDVLSMIAAVINVVSLIFFLIFILVINSRDKLRIDQLNIAICLLCGTIIFMSGSLFSKNMTMCSLSALTSQFFFLSAFVWKLILGINVVRLIASLRYENEDWMVKYRWIMLVAGYSIPLFIVILSGNLYWEYYGLVSDTVCWIDARSKAFLSFLIPVGIIVAVNTIGLFFIANTLIRNYINTRKTRMNESNELIVFIQLLVSMGLTWIPSYFAIVYLYAMYLFVLFFPLQGLMMFLLVVVINKENREKVSSFILNSYHTITSKSVSTSEGKANSKSKSSGQSKATEESDNLLTLRDKSQGKEECVDRNLLIIADDMDEGRLITKC